jgi:hypothetical protein
MGYCGLGLEIILISRSEKDSWIFALAYFHPTYRVISK